MSTSNSALPSISLCDSLEQDVQALETIIDDQVYIIRHFFSPSVCQNVLKHLETQDWSFTDDIRVGEACRFHSPQDSHRLWNETKLDEIALANNKLAKDMLSGLSPNIRVYQYLPGQFFSPHCEFCFLSIRGCLTK